MASVDLRDGWFFFTSSDADRMRVVSHLFSHVFESVGRANDLAEAADCLVDGSQYFHEADPDLYRIAVPVFSKS